MPTTTVTIFVSSAKATSVVTMDKTHDESDASLSLAFNNTATTKQISPATAKSQTIFTVAKTHDETDSTLTLSFNTTFNLQVTSLLAIGLSAGLEVLDVKPIIFYSRTGDPAALMYSRTDDTKPAIFYSRPPLVVINKTDTSLSGLFHTLRERRVPEVSATDAQEIISMAQSQNKTDTSMTGGFNWSVA